MEYTLYDSYYNSVSNSGFTGYYTGTSIVSIFSLIATWMVYKKAGKEGWAALIPIYNMVVLFQIVDIDPKKLWWLLLPVIGIIIVLVYYLIAMFKLAKKFGKPDIFGLGLILLNPVFMGILAFSKDAKYQK